MAQIGRELDVGTVLEGSVRKAGNRLRITAQLINVSDGFHLWSERYDRDMDDIFAVQDDIARTVVEKLKVKLLGAENTPLVKRPTDNVEAYNLFLKGRYFHTRVAASALEKGLECFRQALVLEPAYALALAGIAQILASQVVLSLVAPLEVMPKAKESSLRAIALDETVADVHFALAFVLDVYEWNWLEAEREYRRALELNPEHWFARGHYALLLAQVGRAATAVAESRLAVERDPLSPVARAMLVMMLLLARRFDVAVAEAHAGLELEPTQHLFYLYASLALSGQGRYDEAVETCKQGTALTSDDVYSQAHLGLALGLAGHRQDALKILDDLEQRRSHTYVSGTLLAWVSLGLGDHDQAISWLQLAAEERDAQIPFLKTQFVFDPVRSDPRFQALLKKMNFPASADQPSSA